MKQVQLSEYGSADVLKVVEVEVPKPGDGELLVKVEAIGVNYSDVLRRRNRYFMPTPLPYVLGVEAVGQVVGTGNSAETAPFEMDSNVLAILPDGGGYAEYVTANPQYCVPLPPSISLEAATAIFVQGSTAYLILHEVAQDIQGKTILVQAAAGGVGSLLVQLAKLGGAKVIAAGSSAQKLETAKKLGADEAVNYTTPGWADKVIEMNGGRKVDLILEMVGGDIYTQSFGCLRQGGTMIVYGAASGQQGLIHSEHFVDESHNLLSFNLAHFIQNKPAVWQAALGAVIGLLAENKITVQVAHKFALSEVVEAHKQLEARQTTGKIVLTP